jgi:hypothetical protein
VLPATFTTGKGREAARRRHALTAAAVALRRPDHHVAAASAAVLHGLPLLEPAGLPQLVTGTNATLGRRDAAHIRFARVAEADAEEWYGIPVTTSARTVVDLARFEPRSGLMAADAALHEGLLSRRDLDAVLGRSAGLHGIRRAREVLAIASPLIESPLESLTHLALHEDGFPAPELQVALRGADGTQYRVDFFWPQRRVVLEADGRGKYRDEELWREKRREIALTRAGYRVVRVIWRDVLRDWPATAAWLKELLHSTP